MRYNQIFIKLGDVEHSLSDVEALRVLASIAAQMNDNTRCNHTDKPHDWTDSQCYNCGVER